MKTNRIIKDAGLLILGVLLGLAIGTAKIAIPQQIYDDPEALWRDTQQRILRAEAERMKTREGQIAQLTAQIKQRWQKDGIANVDAATLQVQVDQRVWAEKDEAGKREFVLLFARYFELTQGKPYALVVSKANLKLAWGTSQPWVVIYQ